MAVAVSVVLLVALLAGCTSTQGLVRTIEVSAVGEVTVDPDIATFSIQVSEKGETTKEAQRFANEKMSALLSILRDMGVADTDLKTTGLTLRPSYVWIENKQVLDAQVASQSVSVKVRTLSDVGAIIDRLGEVSNITLTSILFDRENKEEGLTQARQLAVANAAKKAHLYAAETGMEVGSPITISEFTTASNPYNPRLKVMALASEAAYDMATEVPAGVLTLTSTVTMVYEMR
jgi:uncharacterized protein YggE